MEVFLTVLYKPRVHHQLASLPQDPVSAAQAAVLQATTTPAYLCRWVLGIQTLVPMLTGKLLYPLSLLPSPVFVCFNLNMAV